MEHDTMQGLSVAIPAASAACYLIYKRYEPSSPLVNAVLLSGAPLVVVASTHSRAALMSSNTLLAIFAHWVLLAAITVAYRISPLHPLARYPGPLAAKISKFYHVKIQLRGNAHIVIKEWHHKYGDVVRIGPNELSFNTVDSVQPILAARQFPKGPFYDLRDGSIDGIQDLDEHAARRKVWTRALAPYALKDYEPILLSNIDLLLSKLTERVGQDVDISAWMSYYGYDFMGQLVFARDFGMLKAADDTEGIWCLLDEAMIAMSIISVIPWSIPFLKAIPGSGNAFNKFKHIANNYASHRATVGSQSKDLWYRLSGEGDSHKSDGRNGYAVADALAAVIGGSDTIAGTTSNFLYCMMSNPDCCERLNEEVNKVFPDGELPYDFRRLAEMPYLNACIDETLRVLSPVLSGLQRRVPLGSGGAMIGSYFVPEGTNVSNHFTSLNHNPSAFSPLPDTFWPDRWLDQASYTLPSSSSSSVPITIPREQLIHNKAAFAPFSVGPQACPGRNLALMQLRCLAASIVQRFRMSPADGYDLDRWEKDIRDAHAMVRGPLVVKLESRK